MDETRRSVLVVAGGATAAMLAWWAGVTLVPAATRSHDLRGAPRAHPEGYVDVDGWMLTADDHTRLLADAPERDVN